MNWVVAVGKDFFRFSVILSPLNHDTFCPISGSRSGDIPWNSRREKVVVFEAGFHHLLLSPNCTSGQGPSIWRFSVSFSHVKQSYISKTKTKADPGGADPVPALELKGCGWMVTSSKSVWCTWRQSTSDCLPLLWPLESAFGSPHSDAVPTKVTLLTFLDSVLCTLAAWLEFLAALTIL